MTALDIRLTVNGRPHHLAVAANAVLVDVLRDRLGLLGCRIACDQGVCGACTVLQNGVPVAACTRFAFTADGADIVTIEGIAQDTLHRLQQEFIDRGAVQCGYCTSGIILSVLALLQENPAPDDDTIDAWLGGNLCRCTGYRKIREAIRSVAA